MNKWNQVATDVKYLVEQERWRRVCYAAGSVPWHHVSYMVRNRTCEMLAKALWGFESL